MCMLYGIYCKHSFRRDAVSGSFFVYKWNVRSDIILIFIISNIHGRPFLSTLQLCKQYIDGWVQDCGLQC